MAEQVLENRQAGPAGVRTDGVSAHRGPGAVRRFLGWWLGELGGLLPHGLKRLLGLEKRILVVDVMADQLHLHLWKGGRYQDLGRQALVRAADQDRVDTAIGEHAARTDERVVRLAPDQVLTRDVVLPQATEGNLRQVLGFEMDRLTPFKSDSVAYDYIKGRRNAAEGTIGVKLFVLPRERLHGWVERFAGMGLQATAVSVAPPADSHAPPVLPVRPNFLEDDSRRQAVSPLGRVLYLVGGLILLLAVVAAALPIWNQQRYIDRLEQAIQAVQTDVKASRALSRQREQLMEDYRFIRGRGKAAYRVIDSLDELTRVLPDDTWLNRLQISHDRIGLQGESVDGSKVLSLVENSPLFEQTQFAAPVVRVPSTGTDRFNVRARLVGEETP